MRNWSEIIFLSTYAVQLKMIRNLVQFTIAEKIIFRKIFEQNYRAPPLNFPIALRVKSESTSCPLIAARSINSVFQ